MVRSFPEDQPPPRHLFWWESLSIVSRFWRAFGHVGERGPRQGRPVFIIPGFFASDRSTLGLQRALARQGYRVSGWGLGMNLGAHAAILEDIVRRIEGFADGRPCIVIGWSLGGVYAREIAKLRPELADMVFTMGSPFSGDPRANNAWRLYERVAGHPVDRPPLDVETAVKPPVHTVALWSRRDGIVAPACARGGDGETDECVEINSSHMGFATGARAIRQVVKAVAARCPP